MKNWPCEWIDRADMKSVAFCVCPGVYDSVLISSTTWSLCPPTMPNV